VLPNAGATLIQIFFGVADLVAVAAALYVLLPVDLGLGYVEVLAIFMASIVVGLLSHVPGSLGVFESAVVLLVQPSEEHTLPLIGALLAFRAIYYLLPLFCGVLLLAVSELHRWRAVLLSLADGIRVDLGPATSRIAAILVGCGGLGLVTAALPLQGEDALSALAVLGRLGELVGGLAMLLLAVGLWRRMDSIWPWVLASIAFTLAAVAAAAAPFVLAVYLVLVALLLFACRASLPRQGRKDA
jgi:hypothetical protein